MSIDDYISPIKWMDEQVQKATTKIAMKTGLDRGKRKYYFTGALNLSLTFLNGASVYGGEISGDVLFYGIQLPDWLWSYMGIRGHIGDSDTASTEIAADHIVTPIKKYCSAIRFPALAVGTVIFAKGAIGLYDHISNGIQMDPETIFYMQYGSNLILDSLSMYIKDIDPKLLQKVPLRKKAMDWIRQKIERYVPAPQPTPIRITYQKNSST